MSGQKYEKIYHLSTPDINIDSVSTEITSIEYRKIQ